MDLSTWEQRFWLVLGGLLIGLIGAALAFLYKRMKRLWWRWHSKTEFSRLGDFSFEGITAEIAVLDAVLNNMGRGYSDNFIEFSPPSPYMPVRDLLNNPQNAQFRDLGPEFELRRQKWVEMAQAGGRQIWDNKDLLGFNKISILRDSEDENHALRIHTARASYYDHRAITDCYKSLPPERRQEILGNYSLGSELFGRLTAISAALITAEGKIVFPRRNRTLTSDPGMITCGINEALKASDTHQKGGISSVPKRAILRGLEEEFGITLPPEYEDRVQVWALVLNTAYFEWYFYGTVDLRDCGSEYTYNKLKQKLSTGEARDKYEIEEITAIDFELDKIVNFVSKNRNDMTEYGASLPILAALFDGQSRTPFAKRVRQFGGYLAGKRAAA